MSSGIVLCSLKKGKGVDRWGNRTVDHGNVSQGRAVAGGASFPVLIFSLLVVI